MPRELVEALIPTLAPLVDPSGGIIQRPSTQLTPASSTLLRGLDQVRGFQCMEVLQDPRQRHAERSRQLRDRHPPGSQLIEDLATVRIGKRRKRAVEYGRTLNHLVQYSILSG